MPKKSVALILLALSLALATECAIGLSWATSAQAQSNPNNLPKRGAPRSTAGGGIRFKPPNRGAPRSTAGAATRVGGSCVKEKTPLTVLVPFSKPGWADVALTTLERPTFFLYLPKTTAQAAEFVLRDSNDQDIYRSMIVLPAKAGIVSFQLPADAAPLELGKEYQWYFDVVCDPNERLKDARASSAWIQRIEPDQALVKALKNATPRMRPNLYAQAGIWQETLTTLAELRRNNPKDTALTSDWDNLLKSVGLTQIPGGASVGQFSLEPLKPR